MPEWTNRADRAASPGRKAYAYANKELADVIKGIEDLPSTDETPPGMHRELYTWWTQTTDADFQAMGPKVAEYTASDLVLMGQFLEHWHGGERLPDAGGQEAAVMFYVLGKVARAVAAYKDGRLPSEDTLHDITVYSLMARRIREVGGWPGSTLR